MQQVSAAHDMRTLRRAIHPESLFAGLGNAESVAQWARDMLHDVSTSRRDYLHFDCSPFSIRHLVPTPFRVALQTIAFHEGWPEELLLLAVCSNVGWLENVDSSPHQSGRTA